jgi:hypothetical protein
MTQNTSGTPITDAFVKDWRNPPTVATFGDFARRLERDRAELLELVRAFQSYLQDDSRSSRRRAECLRQCDLVLAKVAP